jgi:RND superfamily putative drug exporter
MPGAAAPDSRGQQPVATPPQGRGQSQAQPDDAATTAIPAQRAEDSDTATEKLNAAAEEQPKRRGGGVSAADLLRREGRM